MKYFIMCKKSNQGITLVALVVTIVVLLILAGVSISLVIGQNGIVTKAQEAKEKTINDQINTEKQLNTLYNLTLILNHLRLNLLIFYIS